MNLKQFSKIPQNLQNLAVIQMKKIPDPTTEFWTSWTEAWCNQTRFLGKPSRANCAVFLNIVPKGGGVKPMFKNFVANILLF